MSDFPHTPPRYSATFTPAINAEIRRAAASGIYDIRITNQDGVHVAEFRGHSRTVKGTHIPVEA